jgi:plasmid stabilization system protein ParE
VNTYRIVITRGARQSLTQVADYIRRTDSESQAKYVSTEVLKLAQSLVKLPNRYPELLTSEATGITYRYIPNKFKIKIIYNVQEEQDRVIIVRMYNDRQSLDTLKTLLP